MASSVTQKEYCAALKAERILSLVSLLVFHLLIRGQSIQLITKNMQNILFCNHITTLSSPCSFQKSYQFSQNIILENECICNIRKIVILTKNRRKITILWTRITDAIAKIIQICNHLTLRI